MPGPYETPQTKKPETRFLVDREGEAREVQSTRSNTDPFSDMFGQGFGSAPGVNSNARDSTGAVPTPNNHSSSPLSQKKKLRVWNGYLLIPAYGLILFLVHRGQYVKPNVSWHKTIYMVDSIESYFQTYYWHSHGVLMGIGFVLGAVIVPRTTMWWFSTFNAVAPGVTAGWWIAPRTTLAFLATVLYWRTNPEVCVVLWIAAYLVASEKLEWARGELEPYVADIFRVLGILAGVAVGIVVVYFVLLLIVKLLQLLVSGISNTNAIIGGIIGVLILGICLFVFRQISRLWYGVTEVVSALLLAGYTMARTVTSPGEKIAEINILTTLLALSSSTYIVVRGLDNIGVDNLKTIFTRLVRLFYPSRNVGERNP